MNELCDRINANLNCYERQCKTDIVPTGRGNRQLLSIAISFCSCKDVGECIPNTYIKPCVKTSQNHFPVFVPSQCITPVDVGDYYWCSMNVKRIKFGKLVFKQVDLNANRITRTDKEMRDLLEYDPFREYRRKRSNKYSSHPFEKETYDNDHFGPKKSEQIENKQPDIFMKSLEFLRKLYILEKKYLELKKEQERESQYLYDYQFAGKRNYKRQNKKQMEQPISQKQSTSDTSIANKEIQGLEDLLKPELKGKESIRKDKLRNSEKRKPTGSLGKAISKPQVSGERIELAGSLPQSVTTAEGTASSIISQRRGLEQQGGALTLDQKGLIVGQTGDIQSVVVGQERTGKQTAQPTKSITTVVQMEGKIETGRPGQMGQIAQGLDPTQTKMLSLADSEKGGQGRVQLLTEAQQSQSKSVNFDEKSLIQAKAVEIKAQQQALPTVLKGPSSSVDIAKERQQARLVRQRAMVEGTAFVQKSTLPVGQMRKVTTTATSRTQGMQSHSTIHEGRAGRVVNQGGDMLEGSRVIRRTVHGQEDRTRQLNQIASSSERAMLQRSEALQQQRTGQMSRTLTVGGEALAGKRQIKVTTSVAKRQEVQPHGVISSGQQLQGTTTTIRRVVQHGAAHGVGRNVTVNEGALLRKEGQITQGTSPTPSTRRVRRITRITTINEGTVLQREEGKTGTLTRSATFDQSATARRDDFWSPQTNRLAAFSNVQHRQVVQRPAAVIQRQKQEERIHGNFGRRAVTEGSPVLVMDRTHVLEESTNNGTVLSARRVVRRQMGGFEERRMVHKVDSSPRAKTQERKVLQTRIITTERQNPIS